MGVERGLERLASHLSNHAGDFAPAAAPLDYVRHLLLSAERSSGLMAAWQVRPVDVPITFLRASIGAEGAPDLGWSEAMGRSVEVQPVPGDHMSMVRRPFVMTSALCIEARLGPIDRRVP